VLTTGGFEFFEFVIDIWFILEIMLNFVTGYYDKGVLVMHIPSIARHYASTYLWIDIISSIPISFFSFEDTINQRITPSAL
jgi:hyperpolarization activated cyclic nucleotide-gated potassium channel 2